MGILKFLKFCKSNTADIAKNRLQIIVSQERTANLKDTPNYIDLLRKDIIAVVLKYCQVNPEDIVIELGKSGNLSVLELEVVLPETKENLSQN